MEIRYPAYYQDFQCLAGSCPDSCCKEWAVAVDPESEARYRVLAGQLGDDLRAAMQEEDGDTVLTLTPDRRCPMWRDDGLCRIQAQLGEDALCRTCREFPRLRHDYGTFQELGLELSCPEAARLILSGQNRQSITVQSPGGEAADYDTQDMDLLLSSRTQALDILDTYAPGEALAILLLLGYHTQEQLDGGEIAAFDPVQGLRQARSIAVSSQGAGLLALYQDFEILTQNWRRMLSAPQDSPWSAAHSAMARYLVQRYWLQAVSDLDLVCRVKMILAGCLTVKLLGGDLPTTAQRWSKEIENDPENLDALLDAAYTSPAMADIRLLGLLLEV